MIKLKKNRETPQLERVTNLHNKSTLFPLMSKRPAPQKRTGLPAHLSIHFFLGPDCFDSFPVGEEFRAFILA